MPLSFPSSPTVGQTSTQNDGRTYSWTGYAWELVAASGGSGLSWSSVPSAPTSNGEAGLIARDGKYFYVATAANTWKRAALSTWIPYRLYDSFTAADATSISGRSLEEGTALPKSWTTTLAGASAAAAVIRSNAMVADNYTPSADNNYCFCTADAGSADVTITSTIVLGSRDADYAYAGAVARWSDVHNGIRVMVGRNGSVDLGFAIRLAQHSNGTFTQLAITGNGTSLSTGIPYTLTVTLSGSSITASLSNGMSVSATSSVNQTVTTHGVFIGHTSDAGSGTVTSIDNFGVL